MFILRGRCVNNLSNFYRKGHQMPTSTCALQNMFRCSEQYTSRNGEIKRIFIVDAFAATFYAGRSIVLFLEIICSSADLYETIRLNVSKAGLC